MNVAWWCSARGAAWSWSWQAYPGVWLLIALIVGTYVRANRACPPPDRATRGQWTLFGLGAALVWIGADWPVGTLGAGYLVSAHQLQFVLFAMFAPPLLILGTPVGVWRRVLGVPGVGRPLLAITRPVPALGLFTGILVVTHLPPVVDGLMPSQIGTFALDLAWMFAGFVLWWPVVQPVPETNTLGYAGRFGFLFASLVLAAAPPAFLIFARFPLYALYELSPPIGTLAATDDQLIGGLIMKAGNAIAVFTAATILFFRWHRAEGGDDAVVTYRSELPRARMS